MESEPGTTSLTDREQEFGVESYKQIRSEVASLLIRIENLFRYCLLGSAAVFAWLLTQAFGVRNGALCLKLPYDAVEFAWRIPLVLIILFGVLTLATHIRIVQMSAFLERCETTLGHRELSWERHLRSKGPLLLSVTVIAWLLMLAAAGYGAWKGPDISTGKPYCASEKA